MTQNEENVSLHQNNSSEMYWNGGVKLINHSNYNHGIRFKLSNLPIQLISMRLETFTVIIGKLDCPLA